MHNFFSYIFCFLIFASGSLYSEDYSDYISTTSGYIKGYIKSKVINYDDIPYAKPPVGPLRWKAPRELNDPNKIIQNVSELLHSEECYSKMTNIENPYGDGTTSKKILSILAG